MDGFGVLGFSGTTGFSQPTSTRRRVFEPAGGDPDQQITALPDLSAPLWDLTLVSGSQPRPRV